MVFQEFLVCIRNWINLYFRNILDNFPGWYLQENYVVLDERNNGRHAHWNGDYEEYAVYKWDCLRAMKEQMQKLMSLSDEELYVFFGAEGCRTTCIRERRPIWFTVS